MDARTPDPVTLACRRIAEEWIAQDREAAKLPRRVLFAERGNTTEAERHNAAQGSNYSIGGWGRS